MTPPSVLRRQFLQDRGIDLLNGKVAEVLRVGAAADPRFRKNAGVRDLPDNPDGRLRTGDLNLQRPISHEGTTCAYEDPGGRLDGRRVRAAT